MLFIVLVTLLALSLLSLFVWKVVNAYRKSQPTVSTVQQAKYIDSYCFPDKVYRELAKRYAFLDEGQVDRIVRGLREYFHLCRLSGDNMVSMPSEAVDMAWHEFILFTREYQEFCDKALGCFLHHLPAEAMKSQTKAQHGIKIAWKLSCKRENVSLTAPERLPLLFAIDAGLNIPYGMKYALDCTKEEGCRDYCVSHIGQPGLGKSGLGKPDTGKSGNGGCGGSSSTASGEGGIFFGKGGLFGGGGASADSGGSDGGGGCGGG